MQSAHALSQRRVARLIPIERMTLRYLHHRDPQEAWRVRLRELAGSRVRYGYRRLTVLLKREGWQVNAKRIYRLYVEEGLIVRTQKRRGRAQRQRVFDWTKRKCVFATEEHIGLPTAEREPRTQFVRRTGHYVWRSGSIHQRYAIVNVTTRSGVWSGTHTLNCQVGRHPTGGLPPSSQVATSPVDETTSFFSYVCRYYSRRLSGHFGGTSALCVNTRWNFSLMAY